MNTLISVLCGAAVLFHGALFGSKGVQYILSNTHVFAGDMDPSGGKVAKVNDSINQPGLVDANCLKNTADYVASLSDWAPIQKEGTSVVDAVIAKVKPNQVDPLGKILGIGTISSTPAVALLGRGIV